MAEESGEVSNTLLPPREAADRLESILQDYFAWTLTDPKTGKALKRVLLKSPPGLGKTENALTAAVLHQLNLGFGQYPLPYKAISDTRLGDVGPTGLGKTVIFAHRHDLARQVKQVIEAQSNKKGVSMAAPILRGRTEGAERGNAPCQRWREADRLQKKGFPVFSNLCRHVSDGEVSECPYFGDCEYIKAYQEAYDAPFVIMVHAHLGLPWAPQAEVLSWFEEPEEPELRLFRPAYATIVICDEDPTRHLVEHRTLPRSRLQELRQDGLGNHLLAGLNAPDGLLSYLRKKGVTGERVREIAKVVRDNEAKTQRVVAPDEADAAIGMQLQERIALAPILDRLADELKCGREGVSYSLSLDGDKVIAQGRRPYPFTEARLLVLDGTANPAILKQFIPDLELAPELPVRRNAYVVQVRNLTFFKGSLIDKDEDTGQPSPTTRLAEVAQFIGLVATTGKTLAVTNKPVRCALTGEDENARLPVSAPYRGADIAHFGNIRGVNDFEGHANVVILGREELPVDAAERRAMAIWYDTDEPIVRVEPDANGNVNYPKQARSYQHPSGPRPSKSVQVSVHPDRRVQAVLEQVREAESLQAIDRLRLIHNAETKHVWILCNIPLDIPVDCLTTWRRLLDTTRKMLAILSRCDEKGWDAVSLAKAELHGRFPELWPTEQAAGKWLEKKPLESCKGTIRHWGFLAEYRPEGQTSWSKAIVRHGVEDEGAAIESVSGLPSGSVLIRASLTN